MSRSAENDTKVHPPHVVFDPDQYMRDVNDGLIQQSSRANPGVANGAPYSPSDLKAAHCHYDCV